jgi:hypothetical protein
MVSLPIFKLLLVNAVDTPIVVLGEVSEASIV